MIQTIRLPPVDMSPAVMRRLEEAGLIIRLCPNHHDLPAAPGQTLDRSIYESRPEFGPHKLISVTVNCPAFAHFGSHADNEEFLLIGDPASKPLYLAIALCPHAELDRRIQAGALTAADFVCLRVRFNDAEVSFFTMRAGVPHGEACGAGDGSPASFYVTEPRDLRLQRTDFGPYRLQVGTKEI